MTPEVERLFHELADLTPAQRMAYFSSHPVNPTVRGEVERLLSYGGDTDPALEAAIAGAASITVRQPDPPERQCGPYRLLEVVGRGGMGAVYRAERVDGEISQQVAVKMLHPGSDGHGWEERFRRERQLLAGLNHPSIARLLDAGHTANGHPFLVMEFVDGLNIDRYAEGRPLRQQIEIFLRVCDAVAYAHRNLIIHRDLKPSNILVDATGQPKLLDFGIAKLIEDLSDPTSTVDRLLTPLYASPEQVSGAPQSTATDVYSLGAVLYRMVTGRSPHQAESDGVAVADLLTGRREIEPPHKLNHSLPADVGWIIMKALRFKPDERYPSVAALAEDLQRYLDSRPVHARRASWLYRAGKFIRRNRAPVVIAAVAASALIVTSVIAVKQAREASNRFNQVRRMARTFLFEFHDELDKVPGTTKAKALLVSTAREYLDNLARSAGQDRALIVELAEAYERLANTQGGASSVNMAEMNAALKSRQKAVELRRQLAGQNQVQDAILIHLMGAVSDDLRNMGRLAEAMKVARESVQLSQRLLHGHDPRSRLERSGAHQSLARVLHDLGHLEEADLEMQAAEQDIVDLTEERQRRRVLAVWQDRADLLHSLGRLSEAVRILEKAEQEADRLVASAPPGARRNAILRNRQVTWANLAQIYDNPSSASLDDPDRALHYREKLCKGWEHLISLDRNNTVAAIDLAVCESETAVTLLKRNPTEAIRFARKGLDAFERLEREAPTQTFRVYRSARGATRLAMALIAANRFEEASRHLETSVRKHRDLMAGHVDNPLYRTSLAWTLTVTARAQHGMHRTAEARKSLEEAIRLMEPLQNSLEAYYLRVAADAVQLLAELAQGPERCSLLERVRNLWNGWKGSGSSWVDARRQQAAQMAAGCRTAALKHDAATGAPLPPSRVTISTFSKK